MKVSSLCTILILSFPVAGAVSAQTRSEHDTATAYGARLNAKGQRATTNSARVNGRIDSRINNRLSLRIERYRPDGTDDPTAAYEAVQDDKSRATTVIASPQMQENE